MHWLALTLLNFSKTLNLLSGASHVHTSHMSIS
jgi:hypothetical protein